MKNRRRASIKKRLGIIGSLCIFVISVYGSITDTSLISTILWPLITFVAALFGIKKFGYGKPDKE